MHDIYNLIWIGHKCPISLHYPWNKLMILIILNSFIVVPLFSKTETIFFFCYSIEFFSRQIYLTPPPPPSFVIVIGFLKMEVYRLGFWVHRENLLAWNSCEFHANSTHEKETKNKHTNNARRKHTIFMRILHDFMRFLYDNHVKLFLHGFRA